MPVPLCSLLLALALPRFSRTFVGSNCKYSKYNHACVAVAPVVLRARALQSARSAGACSSISQRFANRTRSSARESKVHRYRLRTRSHCRRSEAFASGVRPSCACCCPHANELEQCSCRKGIIYSRVASKQRGRRLLTGPTHSRCFDTRFEHTVAERGRFTHHTSTQGLGRWLKWLSAGVKVEVWREGKMLAWSCNQ